MKPFRIRNLWFVSLPLLLWGCNRQMLVAGRSLPCAAGCPDSLKPAYGVTWYQASVNVTGKHLSGLLLFKQTTPSATRVVFTGETGNTYFDFEYSDTSFRVVNIIRAMNKKAVINRLRGDIGLLLMHQIESLQPVCYEVPEGVRSAFAVKKETISYITDRNCSTVQRIETSHKEKLKLTVELYNNDTGVPDSVYLYHHAFEYNIALKKIIR